MLFETCESLFPSGPATTAHFLRDTNEVQRRRVQGLIGMPPGDGIQVRIFGGRSRFTIAGTGKPASSEPDS